MRRAVRARVQNRERAQEAEHVRALIGRRALRVVGRGRVQERPGRAAELLDVGRAMRREDVRVGLLRAVDAGCQGGHHRSGGLLAALLLALGIGFLLQRPPVPECGARFAGFAVRTEYHSWRHLC